MPLRNSGTDTNGCERLMYDRFHPPRRYTSFGRLWKVIPNHLYRYLHSLDSLLALGLFNGTAAALITHKFMIIQLHRPLSTIGLLVTCPCLFVFDLMTLVILHHGFSSTKLLLKVISGVVSLLIMVCSAVFASLYLEGNAELNWTRSVGVQPFTEYFG